MAPVDRQDLPSDAVPCRDPCHTDAQDGVPDAQDGVDGVGASRAVAVADVDASSCVLAVVLPTCVDGVPVPGACEGASEEGTGDVVLAAVVASGALVPRVEEYPLHHCLPYSTVVVAVAVVPFRVRMSWNWSWTAERAS